MPQDLTEPTIGIVNTPVTYDGTNFHPLLSTVAGLLRVVIAESIALATHMLAWDGANWTAVQSLITGILQVDLDSLRGNDDTIPMNYHSQWRKRYSYVVDAGQDYVESIAVPVGFVAVVTNLNMWTNNAGTTAINAAIRDGTDTTFIYLDSAPGVSVPYSWTGMLYLNAGDYIRFDPTGCPIGGTVYGDVNAYYMRIA